MFYDFFVSLLQFKDFNGPNIHFKHFTLYFSYGYISEEFSFLVAVGCAILTFRNLISKSNTYPQWFTQSSIILCKYSNILTNTNILMITHLQIDFFFFPIALVIFCSVFIYLHIFELIFFLLPLQYCSNLLSILQPRSLFFNGKI